MKIYVILLLFLIPVLSFNKHSNSPLVLDKTNVPEQTGSEVSKEEATEALQFHNKVRNEVGVSPLEWSEELAAYAQEWADYLAEENGCEIAHRATLGMADENYGENIFWGSGKAYTVLAASEAWYSEIEDYTYGPIRRENYFPTGHYTQMVWKNTERIGIGIAICPGGATIIVASYDPPGNYLGQTPY